MKLEPGRDGPLKWHRLYYLLATFVLATIMLTLYLSHGILGIYSESVHTNAVWAERLSRYSDLAELAAAVNEPGNAVFESGDWEVESRRLADALARFQRESANAHADLQEGVDKQLSAPLLAHLDRVDATALEIADQARHVFVEIQQGRTDSAGSHMAVMDQRFSLILRQIARLAHDVRQLQADSFDQETARANRLSHFERLMAVVTCLIVGAVTWYGHKLSREMREKEQQINAAESHTSAILNTAFDPVICINTRGIVTTFNPAAVAMFGYTRDEIVGKNVNVLIPPPHGDLHDYYLRRYVETGKGRAVGTVREVLGQHKDGSTIPVYISVSAYSVGQQRFFTAIVHDLTQQKKSDELVQSQQQAETASTAKSEFLANMSHEIRTPMTAILGFADILLGNPNEQESRDAVVTIKANGEYLLDIINDILDISKIEAGRLEIERIVCSPQVVVADVAATMRVRADAKGLSLDVRFIGPIPDTIRSDPTRLRQILINVLGNAIKFTDTGSVRLTVRLLNEAGSDPQLQFDVTDSGIGMSDEVMQSLFNPFTQADASTTRRFGGTGLGLSISKRLVEMLGGDISVSSTIGKGSTFSFQIGIGPIDIVPMVVVPNNSITAAPPRHGVAVADTTQLDCRVLLAEDGPDNQRLVSFILKKAGADVTVAPNGRVAVAAALAARDASQPFDVILMDMQMPVLDGYAATRQLRDNDYGGAIVALTAHAMTGDSQKCLDAGCDDYCTKPIERSSLIATVARHADRLSAESAAAF